jgi:hypothetical protein
MILPEKTPLSEIFTVGVGTFYSWSCRPDQVLRCLLLQNRCLTVLASKVLLLAQCDDSGGHMLIRVNYEDDRYDYVKDFMLDLLIDSGTITKFRRSTGWVMIGVDPIRKPRSEVRYIGAERRTGNA